MTQTYTFCSIANPTTELLCRQGAYDTATGREHKAKVQKTVALEPSDWTPHDVESYVKQCTSCTMSHKQKCIANVTLTNSETSNNIYVISKPQFHVLALTGPHNLLRQIKYVS